MVRLLKCRKCEYAWQYKGLSEWYASCPRCLNKVKINTKTEQIR